MPKNTRTLKSVIFDRCFSLKSVIFDHDFMLKSEKNTMHKCSVLWTACVVSARTARLRSGRVSKKKHDCSPKDVRRTSLRLAGAPICLRQIRLAAAAMGCRPYAPPPFFGIIPEYFEHCFQQPHFCKYAVDVFIRVLTRCFRI